MSKTKNKKQRPAYTELTLKGLKYEVISRGMDFEEVLKASVPDLSNWLHHNYSNEVDIELVNQYDEYIEETLKQLGASEMIHPSLRLSYVGDKSEDFKALEVIPKKDRPKKEKVVKEKTEQGIYSGTKKALTYQCQKEGKTVDETILIVKETFEDASDKSIKIWYRKAGKA